MELLKIASIFLFNCWFISTSHGNSIEEVTTTPAVLGEFPHMVAIGYRNIESKDFDEIKYMCDGALISPKFVLTVAHCGLDFGPAYVVKLGALDLSVESTNSQKIFVNSVHLYPDFKYGDKYNDISIIELQEPAIIDNNVEPACISKESKIDIKSLIGSGWPRPHFNTPLISETLQKFNVPDSNCTFKPSRRLASGLADYHYCINGVNLDSGSTIQYASKNHSCKYNLYGFISFGDTHMNRNVYIKINSFYDWIQTIIDIY